MPNSVTAPYDARAVGNYVLDLGDSIDVKITQVSLLKIIYFAHGWFLTAFGIPLVKQPIEAWQYGPVIKVVRDAFKEFGKRPITTRAERLDLETGELSRVEPVLNSHDARFITQVFQAYVGYGAFELSEMTHEKNSPWDNIWNSTESVGRLGLRIRNEEIKQHFDSLPHKLSLQ